MTPTDRSPTRRRFLTTAAAPLALAGPILGRLSAAEVPPDDLLAAARTFGAIVPLWESERLVLSESPAKSEPSRRFAEIDSRHDRAKRELLGRMRSIGCPVVVDRSEGRLYIDANPSATHDGADSAPRTCAVIVAPLAKAVGLG